MSNAVTKLCMLCKHISLSIIFAIMVQFAPILNVVNASSACAGGSFLGFPTWYRGLTCDGNAVHLDGGNPMRIVSIVALNGIDIALRVVGVIAMAFVIYGGFRYMTSAGNPSNAAKGKDILIKALVGMVIAASAATLVGFAVGRMSSTALVPTGTDSSKVSCFSKERLMVS